MNGSAINLKRLSAGNYTATCCGKGLSIHRNGERDTTWFGEWIISYDDGNYSDPMPTLRRCVYALEIDQRLYDAGIEPSDFSTHEILARRQGLTPLTLDEFIATKGK